MNFLNSAFHVYSAYFFVNIVKVNTIVKSNMRRSKVMSLLNLKLILLLDNPEI